VLVQVGQGEGVREAATRCLRHLASLDGVQAAALASHLTSLDEVPEGVVRLAPTYPIARRLAAFDAAVSAAGYNAVHELIAAGTPALYVPIERQTDDQSARARAAEAQGLGLAAEGPADPALEQRLDELLEAGRHTELQAKLASMRAWRGAEQAARWLEDLAGTDASRDAGGGASRAPLAVRARRAWIFASTVPRTLARVTSQRFKRPRPRVVILALGLDPDAHAGAIERAVAESGEAPERILVLTDRLDFAPLLAAGVGFEHVPPAGERQAELAGVPYERFREARVALIRAHRPRPRRVIDLT